MVFVLAMTPVTIPRLLGSLDHEAGDWLAIQAAAENKLIDEIRPSEPYFLIGWKDSGLVSAEKANLLTQKLAAIEASDGWPCFPRILNLSSQASLDTTVLAVTLSPKLVDSPDLLREVIESARLIATDECGIAAEEVHIGGPSVENLAVAENAVSIVSFLVPLSMVACFGLYFLVTRQARISLLLGLVAGIASMVSFSMVYYAKLVDWVLLGKNQVWLGQLDTLLLLVPALVFCITFVIGSQLIAYFRSNQITVGNLPAPWLMLQQGWKVLLLTTLLSVAIVLSLLTSSLMPLQRASIILAIGIVIGSALLMTIMPITLDFLASFGLSPRKQKHSPNHWLENYFGWGLQFYREVLVVGLILMLMACMSFPFATKKGSEFLSLLAPSHRVTIDQDWFAGEAGIMPTLYASQNAEISREATRSFTILVVFSLIATACLLIARTQNNRLVFALLTPTIFSLAVACGFANLFGQPLGIGISFAIAIGMLTTLGQTLQFRNWMQIEADTALSNQDLISRAWIRSMPTNFIATVVLLGGVLPFAFTSFAPVQQFSLAAMIWLPTSLVAVAVLFPAVWMVIQTPERSQASDSSEQLAIKLLPPPHWFDEPEPLASTTAIEQEQQQALDEILLTIKSEEEPINRVEEELSADSQTTTVKHDLHAWKSSVELEDAENESLRKRLRNFRRGA